MELMKLTAALEPISIENRVAVIKAFSILEAAAQRPLTSEEKAVIDTAKALLHQVDVSITQAS